MHRQVFRAALISILLVLQMAAVKVKDIDPVRLALNKTYSLAAVEGALRAAGTEREWVVTKKDEHTYEAELRVRSHYLKTLIKVDEEAIAMTYLDSKNLDYDGESIHSKYMNWTRNFMQSIEKALRDGPTTPPKGATQAAVDPFERTLALNSLYKAPDVKKAIRQGATALNWVLHEKGSDSYEAELKIREHFVKVLIDTNADRVRITHLESKNLDFNGKSIHQKYYQWVENLLSEIKKKLPA